MEAEKENSENIELFWTLFNEAYKVVAGDDTLYFNPKGWCTDMAGANMNGLRKVFGDDVLTRIKTCEFQIIYYFARYDPWKEGTTDQLSERPSE